MKISFKFAIIVSSLFMILIAVLGYIFAEQLAFLFTYSSGTEYLRPMLVDFFRIAMMYIPFIGIAIISSSFFQSIGKGVYSSVCAICRTAIIIPAAYVASLTMGSMTDIWWSIAVVSIITPLMAFAWSHHTVKRIERANPEI